MVKNIRFMLKISYAGCPGLSTAISPQFTLEMCVTAESCTKNKIPYFGSSKSSKLTPLMISSLVLVMISGESLSICNYFHAKRANSGKITTV